MSINGKIQTDIQVMEAIYDVSVAIPTGKPVLPNAYTLTIYNEADVATTPTTENVPMLAQIAASYDADVEGVSFPDNFYLQLSPPASILPNIVDNKDPANPKTKFAIKSISIEFATGKYIQGNADSLQIPGSVAGKK